MPECQKYLDEGRHLRLYTFSPEDDASAAGIWSNDEVALPGDPPGNYGAFAPDDAPEEIIEIASKLYEKSR